MKIDENVLPQNVITNLQKNNYTHNTHIIFLNFFIIIVRYGF